jgi:hypothetical protein
MHVKSGFIEKLLYVIVVVKEIAFKVSLRAVGNTV